ncbi:CRISPR-associated helicase Cas3' [Bacillus salipaludis]|uniref:CRISPR-associated helicase Cas3' n=1 Tax=Bacillus salipaludis TaxID=2547811 RepID=UPI002E23E625|nr:CRISPR-associated helicase Cas3' [Bacillus salipaludis]
MKYYAHSTNNKDKSDWHLLKDHLNDVANRASEFANPFQGGSFAYIAGLLHDIGKYSIEFQKRLEGDKRKVIHSTAGAIEVEKWNKLYGRLIAYTIAGHHAGLPDFGSIENESSLSSRLLATNLPDYQYFNSEIRLPNPSEVHFPRLDTPCSHGFSLQFWIRFLFSSLVDADFLDTERAMNKNKSSLRGKYRSIRELLDKLDSSLLEKTRNANPSKVNSIRGEILKQCRDKANSKLGVFSLTVPTGGGKTLSSMAFALNHAKIHGMERIIYVIPYTTIIEQNAENFREIFGVLNVLEHHSSFDLPEDRVENQTKIMEKLRLSSENWDIPIIVTTNVQFFESLFGSRTSRCRKLHNIAKSVIVMDEAQMIPTPFLKPCVNSLVELVANYQSTVLLCTATQPALNSFLPKEYQPVEIIQDPEQLYQNLKRVKVTQLKKPVNDDELVEKLMSHDQVLCIVNSKKHARILFEKCSGDGNFHLSTRMCPAHRTETLKTIRERLKKGETCRVISTQLIEAGVDVDFPIVYRSIAGIDSIAQAAGRCNREGLRSEGIVYVFIPAEKHGLPPGWLSRTAQVGLNVMNRHPDLLSLAAIEDYFTELFDIEREGLDREGILPLIQVREKELAFPFRTIAEKFKLIEDAASVIVPWDGQSRKLIKEIRHSDFPATYLRKLQKYSVQVYDNEFQTMLERGIIEEIASRFFVLREELIQTYYNEHVGLVPATELKD